MIENMILNRNARDLSPIPDGVIDLVITSPPYNVGIEYAEHDDRMPPADYMGMLGAVWRECWRVMKPGARIAVNVAGVDRQPYIPLHHYIGHQLTREGFLMRGEIIWYKGSVLGTAWGSWKQPSNPVLRDAHEYILVFSKESWALGHRGESDISGDEFVEYTRTVWSFPPARRSKEGHPAPFPVELPARLIKLYSYKGDLVLDPFCGSGTTCSAARMLGRRWIGVDKDSVYCELARSHLRTIEG